MTKFKVGQQVIVKTPKGTEDSILRCDKKIGTVICFDKTRNLISIKLIKSSNWMKSNLCRCDKIHRGVVNFESESLIPINTISSRIKELKEA